MTGLPFADHHRGLETLYNDLLADALSDDHRALLARWRRFESALEAHFLAEEELLLPRYAEVAPAETERLRADHGRIRQRIAQLGVDVELHQVRAGAIRILIDELRRHAFREEATLYRWAAGWLDEERRWKLESWLVRSLAA